MTNSNDSGSTATTERLRSSVADDLPVQPTEMPSPTAFGSAALPSGLGEPTATTESPSTGYYPAARPQPPAPSAGARRLTAAHWIPLALLALIVLAIAAGLGRDSGRGTEGSGDRAAPGNAPAAKPVDGAR
jgi:hypothetical protein